MDELRQAGRVGGPAAVIQPGDSRPAGGEHLAAPRRGWLAALRRDDRGSIAILSALGLLSLTGASATALDLANLYLVQAANQRIADQSALAAALAYSASGNSTATAQHEASSLATVNGVSASATVSTALVTSPSGDGNNAIQVVVTSPVSISPFGRATTKLSLLTVNVTASAYAEIHTGSPCILATSTSGITTDGGISIIGTNCEIASNGSVTATGGPRVTGLSVYAVGSISSSNGGSITSSPTAGQLFPGSSTQSDPYANSGVFSRLANVATLSAAGFPSVGSAPTGTTNQFCLSTMTLSAGSYGGVYALSGCTSIVFTGGSGTETDIGGSGLWMSNTNTTLNFGPGLYKIGTTNGINAASGGTLTINCTGAPTLDFWGGINVSNGTTLTVNGPATYNIQGGINDTSTAPMTFTNANGSGTSTFYVAAGSAAAFAIESAGGKASFPDGSYTTTVSSVQAIATYNNTSATFGNGSFNLAGGITVASASTLSLGSGATSSSMFQIPSTPSYTDAITSGGTLSIGSFTNLDINGTLSVTSKTSLGGGVYTITGYLSACSGGGGSISGTGVSFITAGTICFGQGFTPISLTAPTGITTSTEGSTGTVLLASQSASTSTFTAGATATTLVGLVYIPSGPLVIDNGATLTGGGNCLQIIANSITDNGGSSVATTCSLTPGSTGAVTLVQ